MAGLQGWLRHGGSLEAGCSLARLWRLVVPHLHLGCLRHRVFQEAGCAIALLWMLLAPSCVFGGWNLPHFCLGRWNLPHCCLEAGCAAFVLEGWLSCIGS